MKKIAMILDGEYPKDFRVRKEAESLVEQGLEVVIICPRKKDIPEFEVVNGVSIYRFGDNYTFVKKGIYDILGAINFVNPFFKKGIKKALKKYDITHLHVHDLPLAKTALRFKKKIEGKVVLDLHENYPEGLKVWANWNKSSIIKLKNRIFFAYRRWLSYEKKMVHQCDLIIAVVEEMKNRLVDLHQVPVEKISVVTNSEKKEFSNSETNTSLAIQYKDNFLVSYIGGIGPHRGLDTAIQGITEAKDQIPNLKLIIVGSGSPAVIAHLKSIIEEKDLDQYVEILGYHPFSEVWALMKHSNVNIIPHQSNSHTNNTIPHKLFQIMMTDSPLLVSSCAPLKRVVESNDAGFVFEANSASSFAASIIQIHNDKKEAQKRSLNAKEAVLKGELNWEVESIRLMNVYKD